MQKFLLSWIMNGFLLLMVACSASDEQTSEIHSEVIIHPKLNANEVDSAVYNSTYAVYLTVVRYPQDSLFKQLLAFDKREVYVPVKVTKGNRIKFSIMGIDSSDRYTWFGSSEWVTVDADTATIDIRTSVILLALEEETDVSNLLHYWMLSQINTPVSNQYQQLRTSQLLHFYADSTYTSRMWNVALRSTFLDTIFYGEESGRYSVSGMYSSRSGSVQLIPQTYMQCMDSLDLAQNHCGKSSYEANSIVIQPDVVLNNLFELHADSMTMTQDGTVLEYKQLGSTLPDLHQTTDLRTQDTLKYISIMNMKWMRSDLAYEDESFISWCYNDAARCSQGRLYDWNGASKACPVGWRLPTSLEWGQLGMLVGGASQLDSAGKRLLTENDGGTDFFGFQARLGGYRGYEGKGYYSSGEYGLYWSSTQTTDSTMQIVFFSRPEESTSMSFTDLPLTGAASVRCVQVE